MKAREELVRLGARDVPIYLLATQGMRDLRDQNQEGLEKSLEILDFVHTIMDAEKYDDTAQHDIFKLGSVPKSKRPNRSARIIEGDVEGLLAWVAVNHGFRGKPMPTIGILEIGGASMQVAFDIAGSPDAGDDEVKPFLKDVCLPTGKHRVYTRSWPNFGVDSMWKKVAENIDQDGKESPYDHPCLRTDELNTIEGSDYKGIAGDGPDEKWTEYVSGYLFL